MQLFLYHTLGCHLCERAEAVITDIQLQISYSLTLTKVDIADSDELMTLYGIRIPVLKAEGQSETLDWPFDGDELTQYLDACQL